MVLLFSFIHIFKKIMSRKKRHVELEDIKGSNKSSNGEGSLHYNTKGDSKIPEVKVEPTQSKDFVDNSHSRQTANDEHHNDEQKEKVAAKQSFPGNRNKEESLPFCKLLKEILPPTQKLPRDKKFHKETPPNAK